MPVTRIPKPTLGFVSDAELERAYFGGQGWQTVEATGGGGSVGTLAEVLAAGGDPDGNPITGDVQIQFGQFEVVAPEGISSADHFFDVGDFTGDFELTASADQGWVVCSGGQILLAGSGTGVTYTTPAAAATSWTRILWTPSSLTKNDAVCVDGIWMISVFGGLVGVSTDLANMEAVKTPFTGAFILGGDDVGKICFAGNISARALTGWARPARNLNQAVNLAGQGLS